MTLVCFCLNEWKQCEWYKLPDGVNFSSVKASKRCIQNNDFVAFLKHFYCTLLFVLHVSVNCFLSKMLLVNSLQLYTSVCTAWLQRTWLNCVCQALHQQVVVVGFGPPQPATLPCRTTMQTDDLRRQIFWCRWSSLLECSTGLLKVIWPFLHLF